MDGRCALPLIAKGRSPTNPPSSTVTDSVRNSLRALCKKRRRSAMLDELIDAVPLIAIAISVAALFISFHNQRIQLRACLNAYWVSLNGGHRFLVLTNTGPGTATVFNVQLKNESDKPPIDLKYAINRDIFPCALGNGARFELQLDKAQQPPINVQVDWKDGRLRKQSQRIPVSSMQSTRGS